MDRIDIKILNILQRDASLPLATIAKKVDLSTTPLRKQLTKPVFSAIVWAALVPSLNWLARATAKVLEVGCLD